MFQVGMLPPQLTTDYESDELNRLTQMASPDGDEARFHYDAATRRLASERDGDVEAHVYGPGWETLADMDGETWAPRRVYVSPGGMDAQAAMLAKTAEGWRAFVYLRDHLGSVVALVDAFSALHALRMPEAPEQLCPVPVHRTHAAPPR